MSRSTGRHTSRGSKIDPPASPFVFVDHDLSKPCRSSDFQLSVIRAHAARNRNQKREAPAGNAKIDPSKRTQSAGSNLIFVLRKVPTSAQDVDGDSTSKEAPRLKLLIKQRMRPEGSAWTLLPTSTPAAVRIFHEIASPSVKSLYQIFNVRQVYTEEGHSYFCHDVFFHAGAAVMHSLYDVMIDPKNAAKPSREVLQNKDLALKNLRKRLSQKSPFSDVVFLSILFLAILERRLGQISEHTAHKEFLGIIVASQGGLSKVSDYARCVLSQFEFLWAMSTEFSVFPEVTVSEAPQYLDLPMSPEIIELITRLPPGFRTLAFERKLSVKLLQVLDRIIDAKADKQKIANIIRANSSNTGAHSDFWQACPSLISPDLGEPALEKLLCLALFVYTSTIMNPNSGAANPFVFNCFAAFARHELTTKLPACQRLREDIDEMALFWIWTVVLYSWRTKSGVLAPEGLVLRAAFGVRFVHRPEFDDESRILDMFFPHEEFVGALREPR